MVKLLLCIFCVGALAAMVLELRQQRVNLIYQTNRLHNQIEASQADLWNQQLSIAQVTAPNAISQTVKAQDLDLVNIKPTPSGKPWLEPTIDVRTSAD